MSAISVGTLCIYVCNYIQSLLLTPASTHLNIQTLMSLCMICLDLTVCSPRNTPPNLHNSILHCFNTYFCPKILGQAPPTALSIVRNLVNAGNVRCELGLVNGRVLPAKLGRFLIRQTGSRFKPLFFPELFAFFFVL